MSSSPKENSTWDFTHGPFCVFFPPKDSSTWNLTHGPFSLCVFYEISSDQACHPQIITLPVVHIFMSSFKMSFLTLHCFAILSSSGQEQGLLSAGVQSHSGGWSWNQPQVRNSCVFNLNWDLDSLGAVQLFIHIEIHTYFTSWWWFPFPRRSIRTRNGKSGRKAVLAQAEKRASQFRAALSPRFPIFLPFPSSPISIFINREVLGVLTAVLPCWAGNRGAAAQLSLD